MTLSGEIFQRSGLIRRLGVSSNFVLGFASLNPTYGTDPIIQQLRDIRHDIDRETQNDPERYFRTLMTWQKKLLGRIARRKPRLLVTAAKRKTG